jgi:hypothetical protein
MTTSKKEESARASEARPEWRRASVRTGRATAVRRIEPQNREGETERRGDRRFERGGWLARIARDDVDVEVTTRQGHAPRDNRPPEKGGDATLRIGADDELRGVLGSGHTDESGRHVGVDHFDVATVEFFEQFHGVVEGLVRGAT